MIIDKTKFTNPLFGRILTAMVTPFTENGDVDYELAIKLANYLFDNGSDIEYFAYSEKKPLVLPSFARLYASGFAELPE